jgi:ubiquinone/menaquinone biosynthesis C-methylase UbiE
MDIKKLKGTYDKIAEDYSKDHLEDDWDNDFIGHFSEQLSPKAKVLDLGCGPGVECVKFADKGFNVYGFDLSEGLLKIACEKLPEANFLQGDMLKRLPYEDEFFDGIFAKASLLHVPKDKLEDVLKEILRILKKNGILHIAVKKGEGEKNIKEDDYGYEYERFFSYWQPEELKDLFEKYNLTILREDKWSSSATSTIWLKFILKKL